MTLNEEFAARDRHFVEPDEFLERLLAVAAHGDIALLHDCHDAAVVLARVATPDDLELEAGDEFLQQEILLGPEDEFLELLLGMDETKTGAVFGHLGLEDDREAMARGEGGGLLDAFVLRVLEGERKRRAAAGVALERTEQERLGVADETADATEGGIGGSERGQVAMTKAEHQDADADRKIEHRGRPE